MAGKFGPSGRSTKLVGVYSGAKGGPVKSAPARVEKPRAEGRWGFGPGEARPGPCGMGMIIPGASERVPPIGNGVTPKQRISPVRPPNPGKAR